MQFQLKSDKAVYPFNTSVDIQYGELHEFEEEDKHFYVTKDNDIFMSFSIGSDEDDVNLSLSYYSFEDNKMVDIGVCGKIAVCLNAKPPYNSSFVNALRYIADTLENQYNVIHQTQNLGMPVSKQVCSCNENNSNTAGTHEIPQ